MTKQSEKPINESFVFEQIRKYNRARRVSYQDAALCAVGIHAGLLNKSKVVLRELTRDERCRVLYFLKQFVEAQQIEVSFKPLLADKNLIKSRNPGKDVGKSVPRDTSAL